MAVHDRKRYGRNTESNITNNAISRCLKKHVRCKGQKTVNKPSTPSHQLLLVSSKNENGMIHTQAIQRRDKTRRKRSQSQNIPRFGATSKPFNDSLPSTINTPTTPPPHAKDTHTSHHVEGTVGATRLVLVGGQAVDLLAFVLVLTSGRRIRPQAEGGEPTLGSSRLGRRSRPQSRAPSFSGRRGRGRWC